MENKGIDVSYAQRVIDWEKVKAGGAEFAILRAGYGWSAENKDKQFERNYAECKRLNIPVGAYWYSYAASERLAAREAAAFLQVIEGKQFAYPIYYDQEYEPAIVALNNAQRTAIVKTALSRLEDAGYYAGLYASTNWIETKLDMRELSRYDVWVAQYAARCTLTRPYGLWQSEGSTGRSEGITGSCDQDICYKDYPSIIKRAGLNGWPKSGGDDGGQHREPEKSGQAAPPEAPISLLQIGPMTRGDRQTLAAQARALGLPVKEV